MTAVVRIRDLEVAYGSVRILEGISLEIRKGEILALVGETGSGKTTLAMALARMLPPGAAVRGYVEVDGWAIYDLPVPVLRSLRGRLIGLVPQDAMAALNPVLPVGAQVAEVFQVHLGLSASEAWARAVEALARVRIPRPEQAARLYPHQLSGGMRQRAVLAMALALNPPVLIADEPTTALDRLTQGEILALVRRLQAESEIAVLWITHDMGVVAALAHRVAVLYAGRLAEVGPCAEILSAPFHPYTEALVRTYYDLIHGPRGEPLYAIQGYPPSARDRPSGCPFHPRCPYRQEICQDRFPEILQRGERIVACYFPRGNAR
jgi:oligopeptide transport system ATP-binding protein